MIKHDNDPNCGDPNRKPFKIGQLVRLKRIPLVSRRVSYGIDIVLDFRWCCDDDSWLAYTLSQQDGIKEWFYTDNLDAVEENDV